LPGFWLSLQFLLVVFIFIYMPWYCKYTRRLFIQMRHDLFHINDISGV
jgi:hypothetical protein